MDKLSSVDELLQKIELRPPDSNSWMVLVTMPDDIQSIIDELQDSVEIFSECETVTISGESGSRNLVKCIKDASQEYFYCTNLSHGIVMSGKFLMLLELN